MAHFFNNRKKHVIPLIMTDYGDFLKTNSSVHEIPSSNVKIQNFRLRYCPYCEDEWCCNGVRSGVEFADVKTPIVDDRLYKV